MWSRWKLLDELKYKILCYEYFTLRICKGQSLHCWMMDSVVTITTVMVQLWWFVLYRMTVELKSYLWYHDKIMFLQCHYKFYDFVVIATAGWSHWLQRKKKKEAKFSYFISFHWLPTLEAKVWNFVTYRNGRPLFRKTRKFPKKNYE